MTSIFDYMIESGCISETKIGQKRIYINGEKSNYIILSNGIVITDNYNKTGKMKRIEFNKNHSGYYNVGLHHKGKLYRTGVHRLVATYFIPNPENKPQVNHIDGNKSNNDVSNLEWCTSKENINHALDNNLKGFGENTKMTKYTNSQILQVSDLLIKNEKTPKEISKITGVPVSIIHDIIYKKSWKRVTQNYDFSKYNKKDQPGSKGERNSLASISEDMALKICKDIESNRISLKNIAKKYKTTYKVVQHIYNKTSWNHISCNFDFSKYKRKDHFMNK